MSGLRATARLLGISHAHLKRLADNRQVPRNPDGTFDIGAVRTAIASNVDTATFGRKQVVTKGGDSGGDKVVTGHQPKAPVTTPEQAREAVALIAQVLRSEGASTDREIDLPAARLAETILKARDRDLRLAERRRELVPLNAVKQHIAKAFLGYRQAMQRMPSRYAPALAAELRCDQAALVSGLDRAIRETLDELSSPVVRT